MLIARGLLAAFLFAAIPFAIVEWLSQKMPPQAPQVQSQQQSKSGLQAQEHDKQQADHTPDFLLSIPQVGSNGSYGERQSDPNESGEQGTEFWPPFHGYRLKVTDTLLAAFTFLLFVATIALWCSTSGLLKTTKDSVALAREEFETTIRARVAIINASVLREQQTDKTPGRIIIEFNMENTGQLPATKLSLYYTTQNATIDKSNTRPTRDEGMIKRLRERSELVLASREKQFHHEIISDFSANAYANVATGHSILRVGITITYEHGFCCDDVATTKWFEWHQRLECFYECYSKQE